MAITLGALCGLAWAAGFRAWMSELAGYASRVDWMGTFGAILLPGVIAGGLLGWAASIRAQGGRPGWRWLALAPLPFAILPLVRPGALESLLTNGLGGGAVAIPALAALGGFSISGRGWLWARIVCGVMAILLVGGTVAATPGIGGRRLALTEPRGVWVALIAASFLVLLVLAESIPFRAVAKAASRG